MTEEAVIMPRIRYNNRYRPLAQQLRREMTEEENRLWYGFLRELPVQVRRQKQFGDYIVDFYCSSAKLVIELDGDQHYKGEMPEKDRKRDAWLESHGLRVVRIDNLEIKKNFDGVCAYLWEVMGCGNKQKK